MSTAADVLVNLLAAAGVRRVFGLPGGETVEIGDAIRRSEIEFTLVHHESSAAFMASATARLTGRPSACLTTLGPGAANVVTGVAHAYLDRAPVIVITAQSSESVPPGHTHQVLDLNNLFSSITKGSFQITPENAGETVAQAIDLASSGRPGPVHIRLSNDVARLEAQSSGVENDAQREEASTTGVGGDLPDEDVPAIAKPFEGKLETAQATLRAATRPIMVAGLGLEPEAPYEELQLLAEAIDAPVIVTPKAKGAIADSHPLSAGTIGLTHTDPVYELLDQADCVLAVGFDVVELVRPWDHPAPLIWIAPWGNDDPVLPASAELVGSVSPTLTALAAASVEIEQGWGETAVAAHRSKFPALQAVDPEGRLAPQTVFRILRGLLPGNAVLTTDVGSHKILACLEWPAYEPNRFLVSNGLSSMGYSLPAAIAAGLALGDTPVVCTTGDAGLLMSMSELNTLARLDVPVMVVVFKDHALDLIRSHQLRRGKPAFGTEFTAPDFVQIAEAHGMRGANVSTARTLTQVAADFLNVAKPSLIEVEIDPSSYPMSIS